MSKELVQFLQSKLKPDDFAGAMMVLHGGDPDADADLGQDDPPDFPGMPRTGGTKVPLKGGTPAQDAALRKIVADGALRNVRVADDHRASLGLKRIRNLGP